MRRSERDGPNAQPTNLLHLDLQSEDARKLQIGWMPQGFQVNMEPNKRFPHIDMSGMNV